MVLDAASVAWALDFVHMHSDGDLFPRVLEIEAVVAEKSHFVQQIVEADLSSLPAGSCRRFLVPKDEVSYRQATQLDPQDSIILSALVYQFGQQIENLRLDARRVFSYRFNPTPDEGLYSNKNAWNNFWTAADRGAAKYSHILYCDVADFYNQVYHHTVENQLIAAELPNQAIKWIVGLLESTTAGVSRGVPVGPHPIHLIAEATLIPVDNSLASAGIRHIRYADDMVVFCKNEREARAALSTIATVLDKQQRLTLQRHKTKFYEPSEFRRICAEMIEDRPINADERSLLKIIRKYSGGDPYKTISFAQVSPDDWASISEESIRTVIEDYISAEPVDYIRLRWFYRRLAQIGHPGAIKVSLENLDSLGPCFANICFYLSSVQSIPAKDWKQIGTKLLQLLKKPEVKTSEYFRLLIISSFTRNEHINHFDKLRAMFQSADAFIRREVILAARMNNAHDWVRELKEDFSSMDPWQRRAMLFAVTGLAKDERKFFLNRQVLQRPFEKALAKWAKGV
ncbi:RNA-directed DNA polymerase [Limnobacter alexandrii]|uniref:RNA-directed DNA polymerase n=1 Tax=Limnobacter alexandrii TaxID=2570352 RepID=UPI001107F620|nr:RNA-directed DNA polymerase [Limnobacter alexandrii]